VLAQHYHPTGFDGCLAEPLAKEELLETVETARPDHHQLQQITFTSP
jgi:BarA-like signal transduction histidine kinase